MYFILFLGKYKCGNYAIQLHLGVRIKKALLEKSYLNYQLLIINVQYLVISGDKCCVPNQEIGNEEFKKLSWEGLFNYLRCISLATLPLIPSVGGENDNIESKELHLILIVNLLYLYN